MTQRSPDESLRNCTVRISFEGKREHEGTGFFVAPGLILTCHHVVEEAKGKPIKVGWQNQDYTAESVQLPADSAVDLALLKLSDSNLDCSWVTLNESVKTGDELYTFGYPDRYPQGDPGTFEVEGLTGDRLLIKFKEGQVRPGFSGSPLLNLRTRKVCGMITKTRDRRSDLGGRGIPATVILEQFPELAQRQASLLNIPANPFVPLSGIIYDTQKLFDREQEIQRVFEMLNSPSSVAVIGESGIGKSSLLQAVYQQAESQLQVPRKPIYLNLGDVLNEEDFYLALCDRVDIPFNKGYLLSRELKKHCLLLILDDVEKMSWEGFTNSVRSQLRSLASVGREPPLRLVVAARTPLSRLFPDSGMVSPFENICIEESICTWDEATARAFIADRLANTPIRFTEEEIVQLIQESNGHPQRLMQLCYQTYDRYQE